MALAEEQVAEPAWDAEKRTRVSFHCMKQRCLNPNASRYGWYGGRGIRVCDRWLGKGGYERFVEDMGLRPEGMTLDRHPNRNGNYEPGNVRWANKWAQANNRGNNRRITVRGETKTIAEWSRSDGLRQRSSYLLTDDAVARRVVCRKATRAYYRDVWEKSRTLYHDMWEEKFATLLASDLAEQTGPWLERTAPASTAWDETGYDEHDQSPGTQKNACLWSLEPAPEGHAYECSDCHELFANGLGCVECVQAVCWPCRKGARHRCSDSGTLLHDDGMTLEQVGQAFGFTRERARQIENNALASMRTALLHSVPMAARAGNKPERGWGAF